jgi:hypothetical protein
VIHESFPSFEIEQRGRDFYLAVIGWEDRVARFTEQMGEAFPDALVEKLDDAWDLFPPHVFDLFDVILRVAFRSEEEASLFRETCERATRARDRS